MIKDRITETLLNLVLVILVDETRILLNLNRKFSIDLNSSILDIHLFGESLFIEINHQDYNTITHYSKEIKLNVVVFRGDGERLGIKIFVESIKK